ncbi:hypothetical protein ASPWEDRAFT_305696 [Aspergillus wentii DTO 134E9]|uniref:Uncharacterized protein n=1 Tax=Aspergillus wentii DTO 134E9 TaxID=1073089 RepID=A0A1L9R3T2_ASPWE|nr:uncharacterized protein ASPWEDRAFT_305696 [Aspergillus wentii DTO 134E9]OJJ29579.1 hypothetical protein ASPWEDRAFT_305696 [Aspergillus wentii DTO 134E9]
MDSSPSEPVQGSHKETHENRPQTRSVTRANSSCGPSNSASHSHSLAQSPGAGQQTNGPSSTEPRKTPGRRPQTRSATEAETLRESSTPPSKSPNNPPESASTVDRIDTSTDATHASSARQGGVIRQEPHGKHPQTRSKMKSQSSHELSSSASDPIEGESTQCCEMSSQTKKEIPAAKESPYKKDQVQFDHDPRSSSQNVLASESSTSNTQPATQAMGTFEEQEVRSKVTSQNFKSAQSVPKLISRAQPQSAEVGKALDSRQKADDASDSGSVEEKPTKSPGKRSLGESDKKFEALHVSSKPPSDSFAHAQPESASTDDVVKQTDSQRFTGKRPALVPESDDEPSKVQRTNGWRPVDGCIPEDHNTGSHRWPPQASESSPFNYKCEVKTEQSAGSLNPVSGSVTHAEPKSASTTKVVNNRYSFSEGSPLKPEDNNEQTTNKKMQVDDKMDLDPRTAPRQASVEGESSTANAQPSKDETVPVEEQKEASKMNSQDPNRIQTGPGHTGKAKYIPGKTTRDGAEICGYQAIKPKKGPVRMQ